MAKKEKKNQDILPLMFLNIILNVEVIKIRQGQIYYIVLKFLRISPKFAKVCTFKVRAFSAGEYN